MKNILTITILFLALFAAPLAYAGPGHDHDHGHDHGQATQKKIDEAGAMAAATKGVSVIIEQKHLIEGAALDSAWGQIPDDAKTISKKGNGYYVVKLNNTETKKDLFVLLSDVGVVFDANFTGKFEGVKE